MTTIDHAERARELVTPSGALSGIASIDEKRIAAAQVHATLALVEQQRIANLQRERDEARYQLDAALRDNVGSDAKNKKLMTFIRLNNDVESGLGLR